MDNIELLKSLLSQIDNKDSEMKQLKKENIRLTEVQIIRDEENKKIKKFYKNTNILLLSLFFISIIANVLLLLR